MEWQEFCQSIIDTYKGEVWVNLNPSPGGQEASPSGSKTIRQWVKVFGTCLGSRLCIAHHNVQISHNEILGVILCI